MALLVVQGARLLQLQVELQVGELGVEVDQVALQDGVRVDAGLYAQAVEEVGVAEEEV